MSELAQIAAVTAITFCWRLERLDGAGIAVTSHDAPITLEGVRYSPSPAIETSAIVKGEAGEAPAECGGALAAEALTEVDLLSGRWDRARTRIHACDWASVDEPPVPLAMGELGDVAIEGNRFTAELMGASSKLKAQICPLTSPECRASLGDKHCRVDLGGRQKRVRVVEEDAGKLLLEEEVGDEFRLGSTRWLRGRNTGLRSVVLSVDGKQLMLREPPQLPVAAGDLLLLTEGCDKRLATCVARFANAVNFRGEPHLPGNDLLTRYPGG